jgi:group I intron endonuclease
MSCGVYMIHCVPAETVYIGSSVNVPKRWICHKAMLRGGWHPNRYLQRSWAKYGEASFVFTLLSTPTRERLLQIEQLFIDAAFAVGKTFNLNRTAIPHAPSGSAPKDRRAAELLATITAEQWETETNKAIARRLHLDIETVRKKRPVDIKSPTLRGLPRYLKRINRSIKIEGRRRAIQRQQPIKCGCRDCDTWFSLLQMRHGTRAIYCSLKCKWREAAKKAHVQRMARKRSYRAAGAQW